MKSWRRLKELTGFRDKSNHGEDLDEISKGMQDVQDMKLRCEGLHAVSSRVAGRAYGFSEAVQELANFLINTFGLVDEGGEIGHVFKEVSRVQGELSKALHGYAYHVSETLTLPTASMLHELDHIQGQKRQYDHKRHAYDRLRRSKVKNGRLEEAKEQFDELAMFLGCRLHSLEQSRPRNLLTQATRHHAAQIQLFRQCLAILEDLDPYMNHIVQERNLDPTIDYLDGEVEGNVNPHQGETRAKDNNDGFDQSSSSDQASPKNYVDDPRMITYGAPAGSRSAPISPLRFTETNGINSIQEVLTPFARTKSWTRRRGDPSLQRYHKQHYQVTEPAASPARTWNHHKTPEPSPEFNHRTSSPLKPVPTLQRHSSAGSRSTIGTTMRKPSIVVPNSGPLPQPLQPPYHADPLYKSGPLNSTPKMSPTSSPTQQHPPPPLPQPPPPPQQRHRLSPPKVNELHKLPPPPLECPKVIPYSAPLVRPSLGSSFVGVGAAAAASASGSLHSSSHASPLPPPPLSTTTMQSSFSGQFPPHLGNKQKLGPAVGQRKNEERVSPLPL